MMIEKDYTIKAHETELIEISPQIHKKLNDVKIKYFPKKNINLEDWLNSFLTWSKIWKEEYKLSPPQALKKQSLLRLSKKIGALIKELNSTNALIQKDIYDSSKASFLLFDMHPEDESDNTKLFTPEYIDSICGYDISKLLERLEIFHTLCQQSLSSIDNCIGAGGRPKESYHRRYVEYFIELYQTESGKKAKCCWNGMKASYVGEIYLFLIDMKSILRMPGINIRLSADNTIGKYAVDYLAQTSTPA